jgi:nucleoside-diphosphate-sugar epimerase
MGLDIHQILEWYKGKRILITGGAGYLATNLISALANIPCSVIRFDRKSAIYERIGGAIKIDDIHGNICDPSVWNNILDGIDVVFHFAAQTSVYKANENPIEDMDINVLPMLKMLHTCACKKIHPIIIYSGTATEVGLTKEIPVDEHIPDEPITMYDLHKTFSEQYLKYFTRTKVVKGTILRLANVYGPGPKSSSSDRGILNMMIRKALQGEDLTIYGKGDNIRDYVYIKDVISAFLYAPPNIESLNAKHFLIGSGSGHTLMEAFSIVSKTVGKMTKRNIQIRQTEPPSDISPIEYRNFVANTLQYRCASSWKPEFEIEKGIQLTAEWMI